MTREQELDLDLKIAELVRDQAVMNSRLESVWNEVENTRTDLSTLKDQSARTLESLAEAKAQVAIMTQFTAKSIENTQKNFESLLESQKDSQTSAMSASKENQAALNRQLKIALGVFGAIAILVGALFYGVQPKPTVSGKTILGVEQQESSK